jgi:hypothetical protein
VGSKPYPRAAFAFVSAFAFQLSSFREAGGSAFAFLLLLLLRPPLPPAFALQN